MGNLEAEETIVNRPARVIINELQRNERFKGTCPECDDDFFLRNAVMFSIDDAPPEAALAAIKAAREGIKWRKQEIAKTIEQMTTRSERTTEAVNIGKIVEKIVPSFSTFLHHPSDCRALFDPIDYVIFSGLASRGRVDSLFFVDVKSGGSRLTKGQKAIKSAIQSGAINFKVIEQARTR